jgi:hypothetical protein
MAKGKTLTESEKEADRNAALIRMPDPDLDEPIDAELLALQIVVSALQALDSATRARVLIYVNQRFGG